MQNEEREKLVALLKRMDEYLDAKGVGYNAVLRKEVRAAIAEQERTHA